MGTDENFFATFRFLFIIFIRNPEIFQKNIYKK